MRKPWSKAEEYELSVLAAEGTTDREAGKYLGGRSRDAIYLKRKQLGIRCKRLGRVPDLDLRLSVLDYLRKGYNLSQIDKQLGKTNNTAGKLVRRMMADKLVKRIQTGSSNRCIRYIVKET